LANICGFFAADFQRLDRRKWLTAKQLHLLNWLIFLQKWLAQGAHGTRIFADPNYERST
jgi:hypothetical protein